MTAPRLLVVGELCVDVIVATDGPVTFGQREQIVPSTEVVLGSSSAITACGAARLGVPTAIVGVRGDDLFGGFIADELGRRGVDASSSRVDPATPTGSSTHLTRPDGDRAILTAMGSIGAVRADDVPDDLLAGFAHLHVGSYFLQHALWGDAVELYRRARRLGLSTSLDGNFDPAEEWDRGIRALLAETDIFFANEQEALGITGATSLAGAVDQLLADLPPDGRLVLKRGAAGASVHRRGLPARGATPPRVPGDLVDTVGAGDSLAAGFLAATLAGASDDAALALGLACGTHSTRGPGGIAAQPDGPTARASAAEVVVGALA